MSGTIEGGRKAAARNKELYGEDYYSRMGARGGKAGSTGGFYYAKKHYTEDDPRHPRNCGIRGGTISRKGVKNAETN